MLWKETLTKTVEELETEFQVNKHMCIMDRPITQLEGVQKLQSVPMEFDSFMYIIFCYMESSCSFTWVRACQGEFWNDINITDRLHIILQCAEPADTTNK